MSTPTDAAERKALPLATGVLDYFPDALLAVAECSRIGNDQHNPGQPLHWAKEKSTDEADALLRHLLDRGTIDSDGVRHSAKVAWRALALLQRELDGVAQNALTAPGTARSAPEPPRLHSDATSLMAAESWGEGDGDLFQLLGDRFAVIGVVEHRGEWPPDTRVAGRLTCCGQTEHPITCPQFRA